jgi:hypothetical protein
MTGESSNHRLYYRSYLTILDIAAIGSRPVHTLEYLKEGMKQAKDGAAIVFQPQGVNWAWQQGFPVG